MSEWRVSEVCVSEERRGREGLSGLAARPAGWLSARRLVGWLADKNKHEPEQ